VEGLREVLRGRDQHWMFEIQNLTRNNYVLSFRESGCGNICQTKINEMHNYQIVSILMLLPFGLHKYLLGIQSYFSTLNIREQVSHTHI
jgi:hypothetical protein